MQFVGPAKVELDSWHPKTRPMVSPLVAMNPTTFVRNRTCWIKRSYRWIDAGGPQCAPGHARDVQRNGRPSCHLDLAGSLGNACPEELAGSSEGRELQIPIVEPTAKIRPTRNERYSLLPENERAWLLGPRNDRSGMNKASALRATYGYLVRSAPGDLRSEGSRADERSGHINA